MNARYKDYLEKGTLKIMSIDSSLDINEEERTAIITAFAAELTNNIGDTTKLSDSEILIYSTLLHMTDEKLSQLLSNPSVSNDELNSGIESCEKLKHLLKLFDDNNWQLPEIENSDPDKCISKIRRIQEVRVMCGRIMEKDHQIDELMNRAMNELSTKMCDSILGLIKDLEEDIAVCGQKGISIPQINNSDFKKLYDQVEGIRRVAVQKENTYQRIISIDNKIDTIITAKALSAEEIQRVISLCDEQVKLFIECQNRHWPKPRVKYINPDAISMRYRHYGNMQALDQIITQQRDSLSNKKQYELFYKNCDLQQENILTCIRNNWWMPTLANRDPEGLKRKVQEEKKAYDKHRRFWIKFSLISGLVIALITFGMIKFNAYKASMASIPFDASYVYGQEMNDVYEELKNSGFKNIKSKSSNEGWLKENAVISIVIDNSDTFSKGAFRKPDVSVVINYSSADRINVTDLLNNWKSKNHKEVVQSLKDAGLTNITEETVYTDEKDKDNLTADLLLNGENYTNGDCYLPKNAPVIVSYYDWQIGIGNDSNQFIGQDYREVVASLQESGFTNVQTQEVTKGWAKGNSVVEVTVNNVDTYDSSQVFDPDVKIVVKYSSDNRIEVTDIVKDWQYKNYETIKSGLQKKGFSTIKLTTTNTKNNALNLNASSILINGMEFIAGECYIPKSAAIQIEYYELVIQIGQTAKSFEKDQMYTEVVKQLKAKGFTNIHLLRADNILSIGPFQPFQRKEGTIKKFTIDGTRDFKDTDEFKYDAEIVIIVNTIKNSGCEDITETD